MYFRPAESTIGQLFEWQNLPWKEIQAAAIYIKLLQ